MIVCLVNRDVDQVHDMMDDIAEQQDVAKEISDAISNPVAFGKMNHHCYLFFIFQIYECLSLIHVFVWHM